MTVRDTLRQPSTVAGLAALCGALEAVLTKQMTWAAALPIVVGAVVSVLLPDNNAAKADAETLARAAEQLAAQLKAPSQAPQSEEKH